MIDVPQSHIETRCCFFPDTGTGERPAAVTKANLAGKITIGEYRVEETITVDMTQGNGRWQRGRKCYDLARALAEERGWDFGWRLVEADGVGHDHTKMFDDEACAEAFGFDR